MRSLLAFFVFWACYPGMGDAMGDVAVLFEEETGHNVTVVALGTAAIARQVDRGAPVDLIMTASAEWMDWLNTRGRLKSESILSLLGNDLVVVGPVGTSEVESLSDALGTQGRIATALLDAIPAGQYAKQSLIADNLLDTVQPRIVQTDHVRAALQLVRLGEVPRGIVYRTDAQSVDDVELIHSIAAHLHAPIDYPVALSARSTVPEAGAFHAFLQSTSARTVFEAHGFVWVGQ
jgi:molybdate transport system substrate-binding protein